MKKNKKGLMIAALALCGVMVIPLNACGDEDVAETPEHVHDYTWSVYKEATCNETGLELGVCADDGAQAYREIAVNPNAHSYGEWEITKEPTDDEEGLAVKTCVYDNAEIEATLPKLSEEDEYDDVKTVAATFASEGSKTYVLNHSEGEIAYTTTIAKRDISTATVAEAVQLGVDNKSAVKNGTAELGFGYGANPVATTFGASWEYGDNYTYIRDDNNADYQQGYYSVQENGDLFGVIVDSYGNMFRLEENVYSVDIINGFAFYLTYSTANTKYYGVENLVAGLYEWAQVTDSNDFEETIETFEDGETVYNFSFNTRHQADDNYYLFIEVSFTLSTDLAFKTVSVKSAVYNVETGAGLEENEDGTTVPVNAEEEHYLDVIEIEQTTYGELIDSITQLPENPYEMDKVLINDFYLDGFEGETDVVIRGVAGTTSDQVEFIYTPDTALMNLDTIIISRINDDGTEEVCSLDTSLWAYNPEKGVYQFLANVPGTYNLVARTRSSNLEYYFTYFADLKSPTTTEFGSTVYTYNSTTNTYVGSGSVSNVTKQIYEGKPLYFTGYITDPVMYDGSFTVELTGDNKDDATLVETVLNGENVWQFKSSVVGTYTIKVISTRNSVASKTITVNVVEAPDVSGKLSGEWENQLKGYDLQFTPDEEGATSGVVVITDGLNQSGTYNYSLENGEINLTNVSGVDDIDYRLVFNDLYNLALTWQDEFGETTWISLNQVEVFDPFVYENAELALTTDSQTVLPFTFDHDASYEIKFTSTYSMWQWGFYNSIKLYVDGELVNWDSVSKTGSVGDSAVVTIPAGEHTISFGGVTIPAGKGKVTITEQAAGLFEPYKFIQSVDMNTKYAFTVTDEGIYGVSFSTNQDAMTSWRNNFSMLAMLVDGVVVPWTEATTNGHFVYLYLSAGDHTVSFTGVTMPEGAVNTIRIIQVDPTLDLGDATIEYLSKGTAQDPHHLTGEYSVNGTGNGENIYYLLDLSSNQYVITLTLSDPDAEFAFGLLESVDAVLDGDSLTINVDIDSDEIYYLGINYVGDYTISIAKVNKQATSLVVGEAGNTLTVTTNSSNIYVSVETPGSYYFTFSGDSISDDLEFNIKHEYLPGMTANADNNYTVQIYLYNTNNLTLSCNYNVEVTLTITYIPEEDETVD